MSQKILAAIDGSEHGIRTAHRAAEEAIKIDAELILLHAFIPRELTLEELDYAEKRCGSDFRKLVTGGVLTEYQHEDKATPPSIKDFIEARDSFFKLCGEDILERATKEAFDTGIDEVSTVLEEGDPCQAVLDTAKEENVDMIVIGSSEHSPIANFFMGNKVKKILLEADRTVLTVE